MRSRRGQRRRRRTMVRRVFLLWFSLRSLLFSLFFLLRGCKDLVELLTKLRVREPEKGRKRGKERKEREKKDGRKKALKKNALLTQAIEGRRREDQLIPTLCALLFEEGDGVHTIRGSEGRASSAEAKSGKHSFFCFFRLFSPFFREE